MIIIEPFGGLGNRMRVIASGLKLQKELNTRLTIIWNENYELNCSFKHLFEPIPFVNIITKPKKYRFLKRSTQTHISDRFKAKFINNILGVDYTIWEEDFPAFVWKDKLNILDLAKKHTNIYIKTCQEFGNPTDFYKYFKPIKVVLNSINQITDLFSGHTIGVHVRRSDHKQAIQNSPLNLFITAMQLQINLNRNTMFFLSSDDAVVKDHICNLFPGQIVTFKKQVSRLSIQGVQDAVVDLYCLAATNLIIGSYWSSFTEVAALLSGKDLQVIKSTN